ncbi:UNC93-like protein MFSD11 isoform X1 [Octopus bimaculoides]|uniref:UNC93-like protein MFSD11 isoform X1 n=1 Tax=Octopus bimaculoides TaxID=37653 RepID=UPI00071C5450|nr:UNC93-like protein MFSD11 isoform X1 [Octopus bimaculoides]|eukprot:XP_014776808.1 PREDICTED: UNC93-like protein MFSD11 [Octopus bimaculoides]
MPPQSFCNANMYNVIILGLSFMFIFTAFQTTSMVQKTVLHSASNTTRQGDGYVSLGVIYTTFAICNWIAPVIIFLCGTKISMIMGGVTYLLFILSFLKPIYWTLYLGSVLIGFGAAVIWTAQGAFLTNNSNSETMSRNSGIFWALLQCSLLWGNIYTYFTFQGKEVISSQMRLQLFAGLSGACGLGVLLLFILRSKVPPPPLSSVEPSSDEPSSDKTESSPENIVGVKSTFLRAFQLFKNKDMQLLLLPFVYTGIELTFFSGIYGTCLANNKHFGDKANGLIGISGMIIGIGEILGGGIFGIFGKWTQRFGKDPFILLGYVVHVTACYLAFINLPPDSAQVESNSSTYLSSSIAVALVCSFLLGFGDSIFNTQIFAILGTVFPEDGAPAFALYKFAQSIAAAISFLYSIALPLQWQLFIIVILGTFASLSFFILEWSIFGRLPRYYEMLKQDDENEAGGNGDHGNDNDDIGDVEDDDDDDDDKVFDADQEQDQLINEHKN